MEESPSDSVNGVNADVPLEKDGGEKVVGALLVDDSGPMEKRPQMTDAKPIIIIPFPFDHTQDHLQNKDSGHRRKKRAMSKRTTRLTGGTAIAAIVAIGLGTFAYIMKNSIDEVGKDDISRGKTAATVLVVFAIASIVAFAVLLAFTIISCQVNRRRTDETQTDNEPGPSDSDFPL